jgi:RNA polymerase sigma-70 factor (ECF subfamily)
MWGALGGSPKLGVEGVRVRDSGEFDDFYAGSVLRVSGYVYALSGDRGETEELVQEAYTQAWQHWDKVSGHGDPEAWVRTVAYRIRVSQWRRVTAGFRAHQRHGAAPDVPELSVDYVAIITALREIAPSQRRAVVLHYLLGLSVDEIARETDVAPGTVKARLSRARSRLAVLLGESGAYDRRSQAIATEAPNHV